MRLLAPTTVLCGLILLTGCTQNVPHGAPSSASKPLSGLGNQLEKPTPTASTPPPGLANPLQKVLPKKEDVLGEAVRATVLLYSQLVCNTLAERPTIDANDLVDQVLSQYPTPALTDAQRVEMAHQMLRESVDEKCTDQDVRVTEDLAAEGFS